MGYELEGSLLESCTCNTLCPCWVGEDPDSGVCEGLLCWQIHRGTIDGVDVSNLVFAVVAHIPGNILQGNWRIVAFVDERATTEQEQAMLALWTGKLGGPVADLAQLVGEVAGVERAPIMFKVDQGSGRVEIGNVVETELDVFRGADGKPTELHNTIFTTIPGSPAYASKASIYRVDLPNYGFSIDLTGQNAVQGSFRFEAA
jgi:hypothetical protein